MEMGSQSHLKSMDGELKFSVYGFTSGEVGSMENLTVQVQIYGVLNQNQPWDPSTLSGTVKEPGATSPGEVRKTVEKGETFAVDFVA